MGIGTVAEATLDLGGTALAEMASTWMLAGDDAELLAGLREGSNAAFDWLVSRFQAPVYNLAYQLLEDPNDAPDTVQEVFLKVYRGIGEFRGHCSLRTWIYRIAVNEASNQRRWWGRHRRRELSMETPLALNDEGEEATLASSLVDSVASPYEQAVNRETRAAVQRALSEIPVVFRTVVILRDVEDLSYEEIAEVLRVRVGTVKSRLARGREFLRPKLARYLHLSQQGEPAGNGCEVPAKLKAAQAGACL
jgi:RNA polymerase sigma-70 factor (ECF subfamily)